MKSVFFFQRLTHNILIQTFPNSSTFHKKMLFLKQTVFEREMIANDIFVLHIPNVL